MSRALLAGSKALPGAASGRLLLGASRISGKDFEVSLFRLLFLPRFLSLLVALLVAFRFHYEYSKRTPNKGVYSATTIIRTRGAQHKLYLAYSLRGSSISMTTTHDEAAISNSVQAAPGPSLLSQSNKCRSHPRCWTNLDRATGEAWSDSCADFGFAVSRSAR